MATQRMHDRSAWQVWPWGPTLHGSARAQGCAAACGRSVPLSHAARWRCCARCAGPAPGTACRCQTALLRALPGPSVLAQETSGASREHRERMAQHQEFFEFNQARLHLLLSV